MSPDIPSHVEGFWRSFLESKSAPKDASERFCESFRIGIEAEDAEEGARLILAGQKTTTSSLLWKYESSGAALPRAGSLSVLENGRHVAVGVVETTWLAVIRFDQIDAGFAHEYGEGDRTLEGWRRIFRPYYSKACEALGRKLSDDTPLVCERFRVIFPS